MKPTSKSAILLLAACLTASAGAGAADLYLIAHPSLELQASEVRDVYLGDKQFSGSVRLHPVDNAAAQEAFLAKVMNMSPTVYGTSWTKKAFRQGLAQPPLQSGDAQVIEYVRRTEGAVGYVRSAPASVKILRKLAN